MDEKVKTEDLTLAIQGVGKGKESSNAEVLDSITAVGSTGSVLVEIVSSAISFILPPAASKKQNP